MKPKRKVLAATGTKAARPPSAPSRSLYVDQVRLRGFYAATGYRSASEASRDGRSSPSGSGDLHLQFDRERLVLQARDFARNNPIFSGMIERATSYVVGNGFGLQSKTLDNAWNLKAEALWREYWERPEIRGILSGAGVEQMICSEIMTTGEVGAIKTDRGLVQLIESEQIAKSGIKGGISKDIYGRPTAYHVAPYRENGAPDLSKAAKYSPEQFLFLTKPGRPSATRAVPPLQSSFPMLHRINDVCDSEAIAWQMLSRIAISVNRQNAATTAFNLSREDETLADTDGRAAARITELDYALIFHGEPGEEVKGVDRNLPGKDFPQSLTMFLRLLGLPLGLPLEIILLDWTKSNYSQSRAVLEQAYVTFLRWQLLIEQFFHRPVYEWWVGMKMESGELPRMPDALAHEWIKPSFPWIDQLAEAEAYAKKLDRSFCTHSAVLKTLGQEREDVVAAREREIRDAIARAKAIESETGVKVPWETFAGLEAQSPAPATRDHAADDREAEKERREESRAERLVEAAEKQAAAAKERASQKPEIRTDILVQVPPQTPPPIENRVEVPAPVVTVAPAEVHVSVPQAPAPVVNVNVPQQAPPVVNNEIKVAQTPQAAPAPFLKRKISFQKGPDGKITGAEVDA